MPLAHIHLWRALTASLVTLTVVLAAPPSVARQFSSYASVEEDASLRVGRHRVNLYGIYIPPTGRHCRTFIRPIECGSRAALDLKFKIQGFVYCEGRSTNADGSINAACYVNRTGFEEGEDLSAYLIRRGWAVALPDAPFEYQVLEKIAREQSRGVWGFTGDRIRRTR